MRRRFGQIVVNRQEGFSLIEVFIASAILITAAVPLLYVASAAQRLARSQSEATDLHQRARVAVDKLQRDLAMAGAGPSGSVSAQPLVSHLAPIIPARTGLRSADAELSAFDDRLTVLYVPDPAWAAPLLADMPSPASAILVDSSANGCSAVGLCGFAEGTQALIVDTSGVGAGHELFTVTGVAGQLAHDPPNAAFSRAYAAATAAVMPVVHRSYYFDRANHRLMLYDGYLSDMPLVDSVVDLRFKYFAYASSGQGLRPLSLTELSDGPIVGESPHSFDADLLRIRLVRVTLRLQATADEVRGAGGWFVRPGRSASGYSFVPDLEVTFDVAPRNVVASPSRP
jgi:type II secretory pathway pseudopilin PulG